MTARSTLSRLLGAAAVGATVLASHAASANPTSRLVYVRGAGAESCPDDAEIRRAVATRLGYDPFRLVADTTLSVEVRREKGLFRGRVRLVDHAGVERGARDLESGADDCRDLTTAMALSMSIAVDPLSALRAPPAITDGAANDAPTDAALSEGGLVATAPAAASLDTPGGRPPPDRHAEPPLPLSPHADPPRLRLSAGGHVAVGIAPAPAVGLRVAAGIGTRQLGIALEGRLDLPASQSSAEGGRTRTSLTGLALVPCARVPLVWACAVLLVSRAEAEALDISAPRSDAFLFLGVGGRVATAIDLSHGFELGLSGDALAHPVPFELTVNGRAVHRSSIVSFLAGVTATRIF